MKKEVKNNVQDNKNFSYRKLEFNTYKKHNYQPSLEITMKKGVKAYENSFRKHKNTRNRLKTQMDIFRTYQNDTNLFNTSQPKSKNLSIYMSNKIFSPVKKNSNNINFLKNNVLNSKTDSKTFDQVKLRNNSHSPDSINLLDIKANDLLIKQNFENITNNKSALINKLLNINYNKKK